MNYIKEINAFYNHIEREPLSSSAVALWHTLLHMNNKAMWIEEFTVAGNVLRMKSGLKESSFKRARTELKEKGYIDYQSRSRNQAPIYRMVRLSFEFANFGNRGYLNEQDKIVENGQEVVKQSAETIANLNAEQPADVCDYQDVSEQKNQLVGQEERDEDYVVNQKEKRLQSKFDHESSPDESLLQRADQHTDHLTNQERTLSTDHDTYSVGEASDSLNHLADYEVNQGMNHQADHLMDHYADQDTGPLIKHKQNKKKQDKTIAADAMHFFQKNFGEINPSVKKKLQEWITAIGEPLVLHAMKRALERGIENWHYVKGIMKNWVQKGISTVEQAEAEEIAFRQKQRKGRSTPKFNNSKTKEGVPDWFHKQKQEEKLLREKEEKAKVPFSIEMLADVEKRLAAYR